MDDEPPAKKIKWADIDDDEPFEPVSVVIDRHGLKVPYVPPHQRKIKKMDSKK